MRETIVKQVIGFSSPAFALGLLGTFFYGVRELTAALVIFSIGFAALFLMAIALFLVHHVSQDWASALFRREQTPVLVAVNVRPGLEHLVRRAVFARQE